MVNEQSSQTHLKSGELRHWLNQHVPLVRAPITLTAGLGLLGGFLVCVQAWLIAQIVDAVAIHHHPLSQRHWLLAGLLGVFIARMLVTLLSEATSFSIAARIKRQLRALVYERLETLGPVWTARQRSGALSNTVVDGIESLEKYYARYLPQSAIAALIPSAILVFVFPSDWISGLILLLTAPLIPVFMIMIGKGAEHLNQKQWRKLARMSGHFLDMIEGLTTLKLFNASRAEAQVIAHISDQYRQSTMAVLRVAFLSSLALEFLATMSIALVAVLIGFRLLYGNMHFLPGFFVLLLAPEFYLPLRNLGTQYHARMEAIGAAEHMVELMQATPPARPAGTRIFKPNKTIDLEFKAVDFAYNGEDPVLHGLDFSIQGGERVAMVGPSGAGKSTILELVLGFLLPTGGDIYVNGRSLRGLHPEDWLKYIAWVPQRPTLFHGSVLDNIRLGNFDANLDTVRQAAAYAQADDFIRELPNGYNTLIGDRGQGISGGQIQRIALARAFLKDAPLLLLDEPTASLDSESQRLITESVALLSQNRTVLSIAHRLDTVRRAERILVLDKGHLIESGRHEHLLALDGLYARLCQAYWGATA